MLQNVALDNIINAFYGILVITKIFQINNIQTDDDGTLICYSDLNTETKKKELLLTLRQENKQLNKKLNILNEAIVVLKDNNSEEKNDYYYGEVCNK